MSQVMAQLALTRKVIGVAKVGYLAHEDRKSVV